MNHEAKEFRLLPILIMFLAISPITMAHTRITTDINWSNEIRTIFEEKCMVCHHPGGMAPDYVDLSVYGTDTNPGARAWAVAVEEEIMMERMPPWKPDHRFNAFANTKRLTEEETWKVLAWIRGGAPQGPLRNLPVPEKFQTPQFQFGQPDIVFELPEPFTLSDEDTEGFATHTFDVELEEDTYMTGYEFLVENPRNIHSITAWLISPDEEATIEVEFIKEFDPLADEDDLEEVRQRLLPQGRQLLGQWARGDHPVLLPDAAGRLLRKGSRLELSIQYSRADFDDYETFSDHSKLGLFLAGEDEEIDLLVESIAMDQPDFTIPANDNNFKVTQEFTAEESIHLIGVNPMLGPLGKNLEVIATYPDGRNRTLMWIPEYKQKWDSSYQFAEPIAAPTGTTIQVVAHYDNSEDNWDNPNSPPVNSKSGQAYKEARLRTTVDYMLDTHLNVEVPFVPPDPSERAPGEGMAIPGEITIDLGDDPKSNQPTIEEFNDLVVQGDRENEKATGGLSLVDGIYWCEMRGAPCELKDYHEPGFCDDCFMVLKPKSFFFEGKEPAPLTYKWPLSKLGSNSVYWCPNRGESDHALKEYFAPGSCDVDGITLIHKAQFRDVHTFTCVIPECSKKGAIYYGPGLCVECGQPVSGMGHMDHTPKHGSDQFFMADNQYHHLEGCVHEPGEFKLYFYDDWKVDLDARNFKGTMYTETINETTGEVTETGTPMYVKKEGDTWLTVDVPLEFPFAFYVEVWLSGDEKRYDFEFEDITPLPDPSISDGPLQLHGHNCPELIIPETLPEILSAIKLREAQLIATIEQQQWLGIHCPSYETKDLVWALEDHIGGLNVRQRGVFKTVKGLMNRAALALDRGGDANDAPRVRKAYTSYADGLSKLRGIFPDLN